MESPLSCALVWSVPSLPSAFISHPQDLRYRGHGRDRVHSHCFVVIAVLSKKDFKYKSRQKWNWINITVVQRGPPTAPESTSSFIGFPAPSVWFLKSNPEDLTEHFSLRNPLDKLIVVRSSCSAGVQKSRLALKLISPWMMLWKPEHVRRIWFSGLNQKNTQLCLTCFSCLHFLLPRPGWTQFLVQCRHYSVICCRNPPCVWDYPERSGRWKTQLYHLIYTPTLK